MRGRSKILLIARLRVLEAVRDRKAFVTGLILPVVLFGLFGVVGLFTAREQKRDGTADLKVAVAEGLRGADGLFRSLEADAVEVVRTPRPAALVVRQRADVALTVPADADALIASGRPLRVEVLAGTGGRAAEAIASTEAALRRVALDSGGPRPDVRVTTDRLAANKKAAASALARTVPLLALVIALPFASAGVRALANSRVDRSIEHLLPLPVGRSTLLLGLAVGTIGGEAAQQVLLLGILAVAAPALAAAGAIPWSGPPLLGLAIVLCSVTACSLGVLVGALARSERIVGLVMGLTGTALFATATVLQAMDRAPRAAGLVAIPLIGPVLAARAAMTPDGLPGFPLLTMAAGSVAATALALHLAASRLAAGAGMRL